MRDLSSVDRISSSSVSNFSSGARSSLLTSGRSSSRVFCLISASSPVGTDLAGAGEADGSGGRGVLLAAGLDGRGGKPGVGLISLKLSEGVLGSGAGGIGGRAESVPAVGLGGTGGRDEIGASLVGGGTGGENEAGSLVGAGAAGGGVGAVFAAAGAAPPLRFAIICANSWSSTVGRF